MALLSLLFLIGWWLFSSSLSLRLDTNYCQVQSRVKFPFALSAERWGAGTGGISSPLHMQVFCESCVVSEVQLFTVFLSVTDCLTRARCCCFCISFHREADSSSGVAQLKSGSNTRKVVIPKKCSSKAVFTCILGHEAQSSIFTRPGVNLQMSKLCGRCWFEWEEMKSITADPWIKGRASRFVTAHETAMTWHIYIKLCCCYPQASAPSEACPTIWGMSVCRLSASSRSILCQNMEQKPPLHLTAGSRLIAQQCR